MNDYEFAFGDGEPVDYSSAEMMRGLASNAQKIMITGELQQTAVVHLTAR